MGVDFLRLGSWRTAALTWTLAAGLGVWLDLGRPGAVFVWACGALAGFCAGMQMNERFRREAMELLGWNNNIVRARSRKKGR